MAAPVRRAALIAGVAALAYAGSIPSGFVLDDLPVISENMIVQGAAPLGDVLHRDWFGAPPSHTIGSFRPLATVAFRFDWWVSHGDPRFFHALNVVAHATAMVVAYLVFPGIVGEVAAFAGVLLVSVLAAPSEAVEGAIGRADLYETIAIVAGLAAHRRAGWRAATLASVAFAVALGAKESGVLALLVWGLVDALVSTPARTEEAARGRLEVPPRDLHSAGRWFMYAGVFATYLGVRYVALGTLRLPSNNDFYNPLVSAGFVGRVFGAGHIFAERYLLGLIDPRRRLFDCSYAACTASTPEDPIAWLGLLLAAAIAVAPFLLRRQSPAVAVGLGWFACLLLPVANFIVPATLSYGERLLYLPCIGLCIALAAATEALSKRFGVLPWIAFGAVAAVNVVSLQYRHADWRTAATLFRSGLRYGGDSAFVLGSNAHVENAEGHFAEAEQLARRSIELVPGRPYALTDLGLALEGEGRLPEAEEALSRSVTLLPRPDAIAEYAMFLGRHGRPRDAVRILQHHVAMWPESERLRGLLRELQP